MAWGCSRDQRLSADERIKIYYDSLADELFLGPEIDLKVSSNVDSFKIDFFDSSDFQLIIDLRKSWQLISDSIGFRFRIENINIRETELWIAEDIIQYDTLLFQIIDKYFERKDQKTFDSLKRVVGISPLTIVEFHNKTERFSKIMSADKSFSENRKHIIITYYISELTDVPYPKTLYRLFVDDRNQVIDFGKHEDYDKNSDDEDIRTDQEVEYEATTANKVHMPLPGFGVVCSFVFK